MLTEAKNEAAERLHFLMGLQQQPNARKGQDDLAEALATERHNTVERIRERLTATPVLDPLSDILAILDEEATR